jgi:hypothetical protein
MAAPADQYEAFAKPHGEESMSAEDIAARLAQSSALRDIRRDASRLVPRQAVGC